MQNVLALMTLCAAAASSVAAPAAKVPVMTAEQKAVVERISAASLRGHLSFIASDLLEGRGTPSRGQELAAEYIAAQYRRAGLEAIGDDEYFQTANWTYTEPNLTGLNFAIRNGAQQFSLPAKQLSFAPGPAIQVKGAQIVRADWNNLAPLEALGEQVAGKVVLVELPPASYKTLEEYEAGQAERRAVLERINKLKPALVLALDRARKSGNGGGRGDVADPAKPRAPSGPNVTMHGEQPIALFDALPAGLTAATLDINLAAAEVKPIKLRNIAAVLRGSDPALKDNFIVVSAHYDHVGMRPELPGDKIFNGAIDNGSGTVSLIEIATAMSGMKQKPRRSILFLNMFGEELGMLGSAYYGRNPLVPVAKTTANLNLEHMARQVGKESAPHEAGLTGFDFSTLPATMAKAAQLAGTRIFKDEKNSDAYFSRSDNVSLARLGVPAHTLSVVYEFPDYHKEGDHWQKVDFENMAQVNRAVALGILALANDPAAPQWNKTLPAVTPYLKAQETMLR
ncbi:MAG: M28 family peptidase [Pseudomonadota bacterium]